jgi:hypothetical protein
MADGVDVVCRYIARVVHLEGELAALLPLGETLAANHAALLRVLTEGGKASTVAVNLGGSHLEQIRALLAGHQRKEAAWRLEKALCLFLVLRDDG